MFPRRHHLHALLLAAFFMAAGGTAASAQIYNPQASPAATTNTVSFTWSAGAGSPYVIALATSAAFSPVIATGTLSALTTTYVNLTPNSTYYFRVKRQAQADSAYEGKSTTTLAAVPQGIYAIQAFFVSPSSYTAVAKIGWDTQNNPAWTRYEVSYALNPGFAGETVVPKTNPPVDMGGLNANTTYYFRVRARNSYGTATAYSADFSTAATRPIEMSGIAENVFESSAALSWTTINHPSIQALNSEGYILHLSTAYLDVAVTPPTTTYWQTSSSDTAAVDIAPLALNTTYYYRIGALGWDGTSNLIALTRTFTTLAPKPQGLKALSMTESGGRLGWTALPSGSALGYQLEASTTAFTATWAQLSSATYSMAASTLTVQALDANTTYYFRTSSINLAYAKNYTAPVSSITLANPPSANLTTIIPETEGITVFLSPLPASPQRSACEGYRLEVSSAAFIPGAVISSATADPQAGYLSVAGLKPNTLYNMRLGTLNWTGTPNYSALPQTRTVLPPAPAGPQLAEVSQTSATVYFSAMAGGDNYMVEASTYQFFAYVHRSSVTAQVGVATLTVTGLYPNTRYYFRAGALYGGTTVYANTSPAYGSTLPLPLLLADPPYAGVFYSSVTVSWTALADSPPEATADSYRLEASTAPDFSGVRLSSHSAQVSAAGLTVQGLAPNTTYYLRAGTFNSDGTANYSLAPATATLANPPTPQDFGLTPHTMTLNWLTNSNPQDTLYVAELADNPSFTAAVSSYTVMPSATFSALVSNTTHYTRVTAYNRFGRAAPAVYFPEMATGAFDPAFAPYSDVGVSSVTVDWVGNNPPGTYFRVQISSNADFSGTALSSVTANLSAVFDGLVANASYYMRVSALNMTGVPTLPAVHLSTALTLPATAFILPEPQTFTFGRIDGFTVNWADNGNSSFTVYNVQLSTRSDFSVINSSLSVRALSCDFKDLMTDATYFVRIQARGQSGVLSAYELAWSSTTMLSTKTNAIAMQESIIILDTTYGPISVVLPRGTLGSSTYITLAPSTFTLPGPLSAVSQLAPTGIGLTITHFPPTLVLGAITITLPYRITDLPPAMRSASERAKFILALYDENHGVWVPLPSASDTANNRVTAQTWHLSTFQIMQATPESGLGNVKIYPNPYRPNSVSDVMHFTNMPPYARVKIYTFLGELVRELKADVNGMTAWDGLNSDGRKVASGVYIAFIQTKDKKGDKSFKVAVER